MTTRTLIALLLVLTLAVGLSAALAQPDPPRLQAAQVTPTPDPTESFIEERRIHSITWSGDGSRIAFSRRDGRTLIQDATTGQVLQSLQTDLDGMTAAVAFSSDASEIASGGIDGVVRIWKVGEDKPLLELPPLDSLVASLEWNRVNPDWLALATFAGPLQVWDIRHNQLIFNERGGESGEGADLDWSPDGTKLVVIDGFRLVFWDVRNRTRLPTLASREFYKDGLLSSVDWSPTADLVVSGSIVGAMRTWNATTGALVTTFSTTATDYASAIASVHFSPDGSRIARIGYDGNIRIYSTTGLLLKAISTADPIFAAAWSPDGSQLAYGGDTDGIIIVSVEALPSPTATPPAPAGSLTPTPITPTPQPLASIEVIAWSPDDTRLIYSDTLGALTMLNRVTGQVIGPVIGHGLGVTAVDWRPQWDEFASVGGDGFVKIWGGTSLGLITQFGGQSIGPITSVDWNPSGDNLAIGTADGVVMVFNAYGTMVFQEANPNLTPIQAVKWVSDNQVMKIGGDSGLVVRNIDLNQSALTRDALRFAQFADFSAAGDQVVMINNLSTQPRTFEVWSLVTGQMLYSQRIPGKEFLSIDWSPDGAFIATGSNNGADIWNALDGTWIEILAAGYPVSAVAWSSDGSQLAYDGINGLTIVPAPTLLPATAAP